jgi:hypothetical protein
MKLCAVLVLVVCMGCSRDIRLGELPDAAGTPFIAGSYMTSFLDPPAQNCSGTLTGHEADFAGITRASSSLVDGAITMAVNAQQITLSGTPISSGFPQPTVTLAYDPSAGAPGLWDNVVQGSFGTGPDSTTISALGMALDSTTASSPSGIEGSYMRAYLTGDGMGECSVAFGALLVRN